MRNYIFKYVPTYVWYHNCAFAASNCIEFMDFEAEEVPAYLGWPHTVRCGLLQYSYSADDVYFSEWVREDEVVQVITEIGV